MIYFDNAATSFPKPETVYRAMDDFARQSLGNPGRAEHRLSRDAEFAVDRCRLLLDRFFHGEGPRRFVFALNGTDALNIAIKGVLSPGDHVVTGNLEHNSVLRPLHAMEKLGAITVTRIACDEFGYYRPQTVEEAILPTTRLVALTDASNVLGTVQPTAAIGGICRRRDVLFLVDAAQSAGARAIDVKGECIDLLAAPGHKSLLGPTGTGFLYVGPRATPRPWREGGTGGDSLLPSQPTELPYHLEAGTPNVLGIVGLSAGIEFLLARGMEQVAVDHERLLSILDAALARVPEITLYSGSRSDRGPRIPVATFGVRGIAPEDVASVLDHGFQICVRAGLHCAPGTHRHLGTAPTGAVRASLGWFNTADEIHAFARSLEELVAELA